VAAISAELGGKDLRMVIGRDLDAFLRLPATPGTLLDQLLGYHALLLAALNRAAPGTQCRSCSVGLVVWSNILRP
jgi:hypothetical protein